jgi:signal transduction histidine kinase
MHQNSIFRTTRWRLAAWYSGVMGLILSLSGLAIYYLMDRVHWHGLHQELQSIAGTLHDGLEPQLQRPGQLEPAVEQFLPGLCVSGTPCNGGRNHKHTDDRHILGAVQQQGYYVRLLTLSNQPIATLAYRPLALPINTHLLWQTLSDPQGNRYHQISLLLKTGQGASWGYLQIGRSLQEFDEHLAATRFVLLTGSPLILLLTVGASWWLAGRAMQPVYASYRQIQQFTADAAHELRTPLAAIRATVEVALQQSQLLEVDARSTLQTLERQNIRLSQLVQDLLLLSRMDIQEAEQKHQPCCLNDIISDIVEEYAGLAIAAGVRLQAEAIPQTILVAGDEEQLYRLISNLVANGIQYTPGGGEVKVNLVSSDRMALITVQDTGIGIAASEQSRIFDRFYRVDTDRSRTTGGTGLGLAIAQTIAHLHKGRITVESKIGLGSSFRVELPLLQSLPKAS